MRRLISVLLPLLAMPALLLGLPPRPAASERLKIAVLDLKAERDFDEGLERLLNELLLSALRPTLQKGGM